ncbi:MAG: hypothetical protein ACLFU9_04070 [Candidatus Bathyarchaeia archaeon]
MKGKPTRPFEEALWGRILIVSSVAYFTRLAACGIHEFLGHGLWAWIMGAKNVEGYVSWLGFGWCRWSPGLSGFAGVIAMAGGLINTFIIGATILAFLQIRSKKAGFYLRFTLFWLGYWATITQASYLILGGLTGYGDPGQLSYLTGVPLGFFSFLGFALFLLVYYVSSVLFLSEVSCLFPEYKPKTLLFEFWLTLPIQVCVFAASPEHNLSFELFLTLSIASVIPSLLALPLFKLFRRTKTARKNGAGEGI